MHSYSPRLGQVGSNRKQVIHLFVLRSHENICFIQKLNTVTVCYNFFFSHTGELKHDYRASENENEKSTRLVLVKGLDNNTCAAFGKTTDTLQQSKITRVTKAQGGESEGDREEGRKGGEKKVTSTEGGSEARCFLDVPVHIIVLIIISDNI